MAESTRKALQSLNLNDIDRETRRQTRCRCEISVEGYDTSLKKCALQLALRKIFASCGKVLAISVMRNVEEGILQSVALMRLEGEDAQKKALKLDGTDVGGWTAIVKTARWPSEFGDPSDRTIIEQNPNCMMLVRGYDDDELDDIDIQIGLCNLFSSCGEVTRVTVVPGLDGSTVTIVGVGCEKNAMALNKSHVDGMYLLVKTIDPENNTYFRKRFRPNFYGYMPPDHILEVNKFKEQEVEMEIEKKKKKMKEMEKQKQKKKEKEKKMKEQKKKKKQMALF